MVKKVDIAAHAQKLEKIIQVTFSVCFQTTFSNRKLSFYSLKLSAGYISGTLFLMMHDFFHLVKNLLRYKISVGGNS